MRASVCLVTGQYPPQIGGVGHSAYRVANLLAGNDMQVHVVVLQKHPEPLPFDESYESTQEGQVLVHRVRVYNPGFGAGPGLSEPEILTRYNREMFDALNYFVRKYRYDVLHAFFLYPAGYIAGLVGRLHGVKVIASIRGNDVGKYIFDPLRMPFIKSALENADFVTSVATLLTELAGRAVTPIGHKSVTILNSIDFSRLQPQKKPALPLEGLVIGTVGLFRYKKGLVYLCKALGQLRGRIDFTLLLAGDYFKPEDRALHETYFAKYGLADRTIVTGRIPHAEIADYLQLFDILVFPSLFSEGCPLSMLEAMAMGKVVIGTRTGAIPEIIRHRENGLLVDAGSSAQIVEALQELAAEQALRRQLGEQAAKTVAKMTLDHENTAWMGVYEHLLSMKE